jgi:hypothetical protein
MHSAWLFFLLIIAVWFLLYLVTTRRKQGQARTTRPAGKFAAARLFAKSSVSPGFTGLVRACMGDSARATRLVQFEQRKNPGLSYRQAVSAAMERLSADRSR